jgi:hypothetical protein
VFHCNRIASKLSGNIIERRRERERDEQIFKTKC